MKAATGISEHFLLAAPHSGWHLLFKAFLLNSYNTFINIPMIKSIIKKLIFLLAISALSWSAFAQNIRAGLNTPDTPWKLRPQTEVNKDSTAAFTAGYNTSGWVNAVVPGTVFNAYVMAGLEKDPNYGDNIHNVDRAKYDRSYWYRTEFKVPANFTKDVIWLNFEGINRLGDIYLNGKKVATLSGMVQRGKFDITKLINRNGSNVLAVLVSIPQLPLNNYGSPTYLASASWDWIPYVPGLNSGITDDVYLSNTGKIVMEDPWIRTSLPSNARADLDIKVEVKNVSAQNQQGELTGTIMPGNITFTKKFDVEAGRHTTVAVSKEQFAGLSIANPKLWWPNGYGDPNLYTCAFKLKLGNDVTDVQKVSFGIRKYSYDTQGGVLHVSINGKRVFLKGGNWGMSEYMLRARGKEYDLKLRLHKEMNYNIIRNWLGSTTDEEFYQACDKYGIMVWDDFWLNSNPTLPADIYAFNANAVEKVKRYRNYACIAVWCGNNEGVPQPPLNGWLAEDIKTFDGNDRLYQPCSNAGSLSGSGLWGNKDPRWYFTKYPEAYTGTGDGPGWGLRSEIGTAVFPNIESLKKFIPEKDLWPRNEMWNKHYFGTNAGNASPDNYDKSITERYGAPKGIEDYTTKAQLLNIETNKAMYEGWLDHMWEDASGVMIWMSQSAYPSMVWQTYDYYYDLTGAYWGVRSACEPMHILWNPTNNSVKVVNTTGTDYKGLQAEAAVYTMDGKEVAKFRQLAKVDSYSDTATESFVIPFYGSQKDLAFQKPVVASSTGGGRPADINDGNDSSRWSADNKDEEWVYVDLQEQHMVNRVVLNWENAYAKEYKIQVSTDARNWTDAITVKEGKTGPEALAFDEAPARYVRMQGIKRGTGWGYSLFDIKVYSADADVAGLSKVHFIKLKLKDAAGKLMSENFYWRGTNMKDFTALNELPKVKPEVSYRAEKRNAKYYVTAKISSPKGVAFGIRVQLLNSKTGTQVLPAIMSDNYFTLLKGESREVIAEFDETLLKDDEKPVVTAAAYNK